MVEEKKEEREREERRKTGAQSRRLKKIKRAVFKSSAKSGTFLLLISIVTAPDVAAPDVGAKELDEWQGQAADSLGSPCPQRNEQIYQAPPAFLSMRQDGRGRPWEHRAASGWPGASPWQCRILLEKRKRGLVKTKAPKSWRARGFLVAPREAY